MWNYVAVAVGGAIGSMTRYWLGGVVAARLGPAFPYGTFLINVTGSFAIGYVLTVATERLALNPAYRLLIVVGFLGGYTTFSSFEYETLRLVGTGALTRALAYVVLSVAVGFAACWCGVVLAHATPLPQRAAAAGQAPAVVEAEAGPGAAPRPLPPGDPRPHP